MRVCLFLFFIISIANLSHGDVSYIVKISSSPKSLSFFENFGNVKVLKTKKQNFLSIETIESLTEEQINQIIDQKNVLYIEKSQKFFTQGLIKDPYFSKQWHLKNTGKNSGSFFKWGKIGEDIDAIKAWDNIIGAQKIKIAVIDTGVDYEHPDLKNNMWINIKEKNGTPGVDDDQNGFVDDIHGWDFSSNDNDPQDGNGHGTHCAGVIASEHNNLGIRGVMSNAQIVPIKFLGDNGGGTTEGAIQAVDYAINIGVQIMSNSWAGGAFSQALYDIIEEAKNNGIIFVAAAGNARNDNDEWATYPATYDLENIISVGATDGHGKKAKFSNYGKNTVDVFAPGVNIYSTYKNNSYKSLSGTSMAAPIVSGVAGLLLAKMKRFLFRR